ncbi:hypothetical protein NJR55_09760 [Idiomarina sp. M1R2S28]|uniref:Uncharacterized protein n=1 Tax=Idiomarina rhizosphaerae TaxID=2961572 RepID=A0A9X2FXR5_9GAMM|nr:hypothetical protein [Idiomarina rhizosphaerae]MCP1339875.1 hypothetical protein [Idiomarina rhizosphaerae]
MIGYKEFISLIEKGLTAETRQQLIEFREEAFALRESNMRLSEKIRELKDAIKFKGKLNFDGNTYVLTDDEDSRFCQRCYDVDGKAVRLQSIHAAHRSPKWRCLGCKSSYDRDGS